MSQEYVKSAFLKSIRNYKGLLEKYNVMVAGGLFTSLFTGKEVNDIDCYFRSKQDMINFIAEIREDGGYTFFASVTDKSLSYVAEMGNEKNKGFCFQLIYFKYFNNLQEVYDTFDFTISMGGYDFKTGEFHFHKDFFSDLSQRRLSFNPQTAFPLVSALRVNKFLDRGYKISRSQHIKILLEVSKLEIKSAEDFVKHVGGMYGSVALELLSSKLDYDNFTIDSALEELSKLENQSERNVITGNIPVNSGERVDSNIVCNILGNANALDGGWYKYDGLALYRCKDGRKRNIPCSIAKMFAPDKEVKIKDTVPDQFILYKHVNYNLDSKTYTSIYDPSFKYEFGKVALGDYGIYMLNAEDLKTHQYYHNSKAVLACMCKKEDIINMKYLQSGSTTQIHIKSVIPFQVFDKDDPELLKMTNVNFSEAPDLKDCTHGSLGEEYDYSESLEDCGVHF